MLAGRVNLRRRLVGQTLSVWRQWPDMTATERHTLNLTIEQSFLLVLLAVLPLFESPKSIALAGYLIASAVRHLLFREVGSAGVIGWAALAFVGATLASGLAAYASAGLEEFRRLTGTGEIITYSMALLAALAGGYDDRFRRLALWTALAAAAGTSVWMIGLHWGSGRPDGVLSLGNVNTAALYISLTMVASAALLADAVATRRTVAAVVTSIALVVQLLLIVDLGSRTGLLTMTVGLGAICLSCLGRRGGVVVLGIVFVCASIVWLRNQQLLEKFGWINLDGLDGLVGARADMWRLGASVFLENPVLGVGWRNIRYVDSQALGFDFAPGSEAANVDHAHNQFLNLLAEGGLVGFVFLATLAGLIVWRLWRARPAVSAVSPPWLAGVGVLPALLAGGMFELVVVAEVALLAVLVLGFATGSPAPNPAAVVPRFRRAR